jgi:hypothetical protein
LQELGGTGIFRIFNPVAWGHEQEFGCKAESQARLPGFALKANRLKSGNANAATGPRGNGMPTGGWHGIMRSRNTLPG